MALRYRLRRLPRWLKVILTIFLLILMIGISGVAFVTFWPEAAAQNIDHLRDVIGDAPVAQIETVVLNIQDTMQQLEYQLGLRQPTPPWTATQPHIPIHNTQPRIVAAARTATPITSNAPIKNSTDMATTVTTSSSSKLATQSTSLVTSTPVSPLPTESPAWQIAALAPLGKITGEGQWQPYLYTSDGQVVAYRTFLQGDPRRPYSIAAIVAFNLQTTRLHFVLGTIEPIPFKAQPGRTGAIPANEMQPGVLLATFNGGFKARHGQYGAMADGITALPPITGLATVAINANGTVQIGQWGTEIQDSPNLVAWRQNGKLLVHNGEVNPATAVGTELWGRTIKGEDITWRSGVGLSGDGQTLYYAAGAQLDVPTLAKVMLHAGAANALQLDVNNFWVHFAAIRSEGSTLTAEPLLDTMNQQVDRYLKSYNRDFFYLTAVPRA